MRAGEGRIHEGFRQIDLAAVAQILGEPLQQPIEATRALPLLKTPMTGLIRRIAAGQVVPGRPGPEDPQHAVQDAPRIHPRPAAPIGAPSRTEDRFEHGPLRVSEVHAVEYDGHRNFVHPLRAGL